MNTSSHMTKMICTLTKLETTVALETTGIARYANDDQRKPNMKAKNTLRSRDRHMFS